MVDRQPEVGRNIPALKEQAEQPPLLQSDQDSIFAMVIAPSLQCPLQCPSELNPFKGTGPAGFSRPVRTDL